jgi:hypothetical protein
MMLTQTEVRPKYLMGKIFLGILLILPWVIVDIVLKKQEPSLGYLLGIVLGMTSCHILSGRPKFSFLLIIMALLTINHFVLVPYWGKL